MRITNFRKVIYTMILLFVTAWIYFSLPVLNTWFYEPIWLIIFLLLVLSYFFTEDIDDNVKITKKSKNVLKVAGGVFLGTILIAFFTTADIFHAEKYRKVIGEVKPVKNFNDIGLSVSVNQIRIVDKDMAKKLGEKKLGEKMGLGSSVELGDFHIQKVKTGLFWVAPLEYRNFFKWLGSNGTPGYIMVSASNEKDVRLILELDGKPLKLIYQKSAYGNEFIKRYLYLNGYFNIGLTDFTFELDDNLRPYYVVSVYNKTVGFSGENVIKTLIVDVQSGEINEYSIENTPSWVDRIQPEDFINTQINDWGEYIHGYWNSTLFTDQKEVLKLSSSQSLIYADNGKSYWYSATSSVGRDESIVGFLLTDTRTKESFFIKQAGATEKAAKNSAEGKVQEKGYNATEPILYNINGISTYIMTLKDKEGLIKMIAMVSVKKYSIVGIGNNLQSALRDYKTALYSNGNSLNLDNKSNGFKSITEKVLWIKSDINKGKSYYYFRLQGQNFVFVGTSDISERLIFTKKGDNVKVLYKPSKDLVIDIIKFENNDILK